MCAAARILAAAVAPAIGCRHAVRSAGKTIENQPGARAVRTATRIGLTKPWGKFAAKCAAPRARARASITWEPGCAAGFGEGGMARSAMLIACVVAACLALSPALAQTGFDRPGGDLMSFPVNSGDPAVCAARCER